MSPHEINKSNIGEVYDFALRENDTEAMSFYINELEPISNEAYNKIENLFRVEKLLFTYYSKYGNYQEVTPGMLQWISTFSKKPSKYNKSSTGEAISKAKISNIVKALIKAGWTPQKHVRLTLSKSRDTDIKAEIREVNRR